MPARNKGSGPFGAVTLYPVQNCHQYQMRVGYMFFGQGQPLALFLVRTATLETALP